MAYREIPLNPKHATIVKNVFAVRDQAVRDVQTVLGTILAGYEVSNADKVELIDREGRLVLGFVELSDEEAKLRDEQARAAIASSAGDQVATAVLQKAVEAAKTNGKLELTPLGKAAAREITRTLKQGRSRIRVDQ